MKSLLPVAVFSLVTLGCATHHVVHVTPVEVAPIHLTMDVNVHVDGQVGATLEDEKPPQEP